MKYILICFFFIAVIVSCSETYYDYSVDTNKKSGIKMIVDTLKWEIDTFIVRKLDNEAVGDTAQFSYIEVKVLDTSFPFPKQFTAIFYFNPGLQRMVIEPFYQETGLISSIKLVERTPENDYRVAKFNIDINQSFVPEVDVFEYNHRHRFISGTIEGALYRPGTNERRTIKFDFTNLKIK